ncbi:acetoin utilization protein AcuA [Salirhabdus euzebyi]|uniref:Acetoin utilization protein AcuA n=1 Tax=Salirhabdus euzebyi TaxID=394506 RepID=A0A841PWC6_9BACI|nr:GNAT family N-acetyltransferase [Salirhabdus euzebyi]MBB6452134.1 acetoin utilization protein AcuA [Salirhabdus euzebyi]
MKHRKTYHSATIETDDKALILEGPLSSDQLAKYNFHEGLKAFRPPKKQFEALKQIADFEEGRILVARDGDMIVGYVTYLYPDPLERWSKFQMKDLIELGAIEVAAEYRSLKIGSNLIRLAMMDEFMENYIIITTEYYWHWDLKGTGLSVWEYRYVMEKMMGAGGLKPFPTDDPEIASHPANCLLAYIGENVPEESVKQFEELRFLGRNRQDWF